MIRFPTAVIPVPPHPIGSTGQLVEKPAGLLFHRRIVCRAIRQTEWPVSELEAGV